MSRVLKPDVLIIGGGVAGCAAALSFHKKGKSVLLVEREAEPKGRFRGEYLQPHAVQFLNALGFKTLVDGPETVKIRRLRFRDVDAENNIISETIVRYPVGAYAAVMPNEKLVRSLRTHAKDVLQEKFLVGAGLEPMNLDAPDFHLAPKFSIKLADGETVQVEPRWVIGCDGRQSTTRRWIGGKASTPIGAATIGSPEEFIIGTEIKGRAEGGGSLADLYEVIRTENRGTIALFKLDEASRRCYWSAPRQEKGNTKKEWQAELGQLLDGLTKEKGFDVQRDSNLADLAGTSAQTEWLGPASKGRIFLAGDSLAVTTPFGGQGMTCAVLHVQELTNLLTETADQSEKSIEDVGERFAISAKRLFYHFNLINFGLYYLFFARNTLFKSTTAHVLASWRSRPDLADRVGRLFGGIDLDTPGVLELAKLWGLSPKINIGAQIPVFRRARIAQPPLGAWSSSQTARFEK